MSYCPRAHVLTTEYALSSLRSILYAIVTACVVLDQVPIHLFDMILLHMHISVKYQ